MIIITYEPLKHEINMNGHANYNKNGEDIICSSASMLCYTLAQSIQYMLLALTEPPLIIMNNGTAKVSCVPKEKYIKNIDLIYWTVLNGFDLLAQNYPDYVSFKVIEG